MARRAALLDIRGDELEQQRVQLEHNLQQTNFSLPDEYSDVEYPRHAFGRSSPLSAFSSLAWSYHTEDGLQPYTAESLSTAAHHASALTISAGLGGGRATRRDLSLSGAEYDPERPLQGIMRKVSISQPARTTSTIDFDPLIVDDTAELDRVLQSGHAPSIRSTRSLSSSSGSDTTEPLSPQPQQDSRPRLSDALNHLAFSPKRPRSAQGLPSPRLGNVTMRTSVPELSRRPLDSSSMDPFPALTPRQPRRLNQSLSYAQISVEPEVNILPATPSFQQHEREKDDSSKFTTMARGLAREIEAEADAMLKRNPRYAAAADSTPKAHNYGTMAAKSKRQRSPYRQKTNEKSHAATPYKKSVQLPDVTGLTSAIASPAKMDLEFYGYDLKETTQAEARFVATLSVVQNKLAYLETENSVSRRRVRELELELEACKKEVARERTRIIEHEQSMRDDDLAHAKPRIANQRDRVQQQQKKAEEDQTALAAAEARYKAAVEEKKALEALITTLLAHLTRLTAELSEHKQLLLELRSLRDSDAYALAEKSKEVDKLKQEVERLAGEVEVLRGVVEEGLKERRNFREQPMTEQQTSEISHRTQEMGERPPEDLSQAPSKPFLDVDELSRITQEVEERRSERSIQLQEKSPSETVPAFPQIRGAQLERLFFSAPEHNTETCTVCHRKRRRRGANVEQVVSEDMRDRERRPYSAKSARDRRGDDRVPPQTVLSSVLRELEDDFTHYKSIYVELADQYKDMDPVSNVVKRNVLADHLREVIDVLERKGNQIASLYDLLDFKDKPINESVISVVSTAPKSAAAATSQGTYLQTRRNNSS